MLYRLVNRFLRIKFHNLTMSDTSETELDSVSTENTTTTTTTNTSSIYAGHGNCEKLSKSKKTNKFEPPQQTGASHTRGTFIGVFCPSFVNIINIIYYIRLPYVIGVAGGKLTFMGLSISFLLVLITLFSLAAMATNGEIETGGPYYTISRTLGPAFGGTAGIILAIANMHGAASAHIGLAETIVILYSPKALITKDWDKRLIAFVLTIIVAYLSRYTFEIRFVTFFIIMVGLLAYILGLIFPYVTKAHDIIDCSSSRFELNWKTHESTINFFYTFSIIFPAFGGILAGSNGSGALKRPQRSIPLGTITALVSGTTIYLLTTLTITGCHTRTGLTEKWRSPIQETGIWWPIIFTAIATSVIAKGVTGLGTGPMALRCLAGDGILPKFFGDWALTIATIVACALCLWGDLNTISFIRTMLFLMVFTYINYAIYLAGTANVPSFRPTFKLYHPYVSLVAGLLMLGSMLIIHWIVALSTWGFAIACQYWIMKRRSKLNVNWGSLDDSVAYEKALRAALDLRRIPPHPKLYRPNVVLVIDGPPARHQDVITFMDQMLKGKGMAIVARMFQPGTPIRDIINERNSSTMKTGDDYNIFYEAVIAEHKTEAIKKIMLLTGLGALRANVAFTEFDETLSHEGTDFINSVLDMQWSVIMIRNPMKLTRFGYIDLWWLFDDGGLSLLIASILAGSSRPLRVFSVSQTDLGQNPQKHYKKLRHLLKQFRVNAQVMAVSLSEAETIPSQRVTRWWNEMTAGIENVQDFNGLTKKYMLLSDLIRTYSGEAITVIISLPVPKIHIPSKIYSRWLSLISIMPVPVLFVRGNGTHTLSWQV